MKTWQALTILGLIWAMIYLTHLGAQELRGEEARRILPAQEMLSSGNWIVPTIAGETYSNKPPLINWLIAGAFHFTGVQNEYTARLPSVLSLLLLAFSAVWLLGPVIGKDRAFYVGLILLTAIAMIDKSRMAEIETIYIVLFGIACFTWVRLWTGLASPWATWVIPYLFLGIGWLAKGPVHLLFWALFLVFVLHSARRTKEMLHPAHALGILLMAAMFLPWMTSNMEAVGSPDESIGTWIEQLRLRADFRNADFGEWAAHPFEILLNFLPWTLPLGFAVWRLRKDGVQWNSDDKLDAVSRGSFAAVITGCILICLLPGGLPRYVMPLYPLAAVAVVQFYFRMKPVDRRRYEAGARRTLLVLLPVFFAGALVGISLAFGEGYPVKWIGVLTGLILLIATFLWLRKHGGNHGYFLSSSLVMAVGALTLLCTITPYQVAYGKMRRAAAQLEEMAAESDRQLVFYADEYFRRAYPRELRLFFYLRPELVAIGENGDLPNERIMVVGRPRLDRQLRRKLRKANNLEVSGEDLLFVDGRRLSILLIDPVTK